MRESGRVLELGESHIIAQSEHSWSALVVVSTNDLGVQFSPPEPGMATVVFSRDRTGLLDMLTWPAMASRSLGV